HFDVGGTATSPKLSLTFGKRDEPTPVEETFELGITKLDPETKQFFTSPAKLKQTEGYQTYVKEKSEYDKQVAQYQAQQKAIADAQRDKAEWDQAYSIVARGSRYDPKSRVGFKIQKIHRHREIALQDYQEAKALSLKKEGLKPVYSGEQLVGYEDPVKKMSFPID
ncbi:unnamed protein product, partial [marine sediment metagenome]